MRREREGRQKRGQGHREQGMLLRRTSEARSSPWCHDAALPSMARNSGSAPHTEQSAGFVSAERSCVMFQLGCRDYTTVMLKLML